MQFGTTPGRQVWSRSHHTPSCPHPGSESPRSMKENPPQSIPETTALGTYPGWPRAPLASRSRRVSQLMSQHVLPRWHSQLTVYVSRWPSCDRSLEPCPGAPLLCTTLHGALTLMGATRDGCFLGKTNVCKPPHLCHLPKRRAHDWPAGRPLRLPASGLSHGGAGTARLVPSGPPCLWCCHLSWVCLHPSACWKCPPLTHLSPHFMSHLLVPAPTLPFHG